MSRRLPARVLRHVATPVSARATNVVAPAPGEEWEEGEPGDGIAEESAGVPFACILFLPQAGESQEPTFSWRSRTITRPTLLYNLARPGGAVVDIGKEDELDILAADLAAVTGAETARWQVEAVPQAFGPPGAVFGCQVVVKQVRD